MRISAISQHYQANAFRWLCKAFEDIGHDVTHYGRTFPNHMNVDWGSAADYLSQVRPLSDREESDLVILNDWHECHYRRFTSDKLVLLEPEGWPWSFKRREALEPIVSYHAQPYGILGQPYDPEHPDRSCEEDGWKWLPGACDPSAHPMLYMDRDYDFCSMATPYKWRPSLCEYLREQGCKVREGLGNVAEYALGYNRSLCTAESSDGQEYVKWRVFEAMAMGCLVIHTPCKLLDRLFTPKVHYIPIEQSDGPNREQVMFYVVMLQANHELAQSIADNARREVLSKHTYRHRAQTILKDVGLA